MLRAAAALALLLAASRSSAGGLRASQGVGRDTKCIFPPPPLRDPSLTAAAANADAAPSHLKYLGMDGGVGDDKAAADASGTPWVSLGFMTPDTTTVQPDGTVPWNMTRLRHQKAKGVAMMANMHGFTTSDCQGNFTCWRKGFLGPNETVGGMWNNSIEPAVQQGLMMARPAHPTDSSAHRAHNHTDRGAGLQGIYIGDELLGLGILVEELTTIFELCKAVWPEGITCRFCFAGFQPRATSGVCTDRALLLPRKDYNEEWFQINDPTWHDKSGQPYGKVPAALDWISYDVRTLLSCPSCAIPRTMPPDSCLILSCRLR
jgi:hypothetical protein